MKAYVELATSALLQATARLEADERAFRRRAACIQVQPDTQCCVVRRGNIDNVDRAAWVRYTTGTV